MSHRCNKTNDNKNSKPWYEKWYYIIGIFTGIAALLGVSVIGALSYLKKDNPVNEDNVIIHHNTETDDVTPESLEVKTPDSETQEQEIIEIPSILFLSEEYVKNTDVENIIKDKKEYILQRKNEYMEFETRILNNYAKFEVYEEAARLNWVNDGNIMHSSVDKGISIPNTILILLDYETDDIIYKLITDNSGTAEYHPFSTEQKIYCVAIAPDYSLKVSEPIIFEANQPESHYVSIFLLKENDEFTSDFQIAFNDLNGSAIPNREIYVNYFLKESKVSSPIYSVYYTNEIGYIASYNDDCCFFELNTRYSINTYLVIDGEYRTVDGSITN